MADPVLSAEERRLEMIRKKDRLLDGFIVQFADLTAVELEEIACDSERESPDGWLHKMIREYLSVWR